MNAATNTTTATAAPPRERLLEDFPIPSRADWRAAAEALLKGAPFEKKLVTRTHEGIDLQPIYDREDIAGLSCPRAIPLGGTRLRAWEISQELPYASPEDFNAAARRDLARGQTELNVPLIFGSAGDWQRAFAGIELPRVSLYLHAGVSAGSVVARLFALARHRGIECAKLRGCLGADPLGVLVGTGEIPLPLERACDEMAEVARLSLKNAPALRTIAIETHVYHDGGANAVQELGFALATAADYLRALTARAVAIDDAVRQVRLAMSAGPVFFTELAKFRAARHVWAQMARAFGASEAATRALHLHARTGRANKTRYDAHVNMLRATTEALSAVAGGCDSLHVGAYDEAMRAPDEFSRRIARNIQIILAEECGLARVIDPAAGSYFVEWLTNEIARRAWALFQDIEKRGGMAAALVAGYPQSLIAASAKSRAEAVAKRRAVIVGTNQYANARESTPARAAAKTNPAHRGKSRATATAVLRVTPILPRCFAEPFEALRDASADFATRTGAAPLVFQANVGPTRSYRARADWTTGIFEVGGFKVAADREFKDAADAADAAFASGARIVVITAADETYPSVVEPLARAIKSRDPGVFVLVAGAAKEKETETAWRAAGVDDFVNVTANCLDLLTRLLGRLGVLS